MPSANDLYSEAEQLKEEGKLEEAIAKLLSALELEPNYALAHSALAVFYGKIGKYEEAIQHGQKVCELEPEDSFSYTALSVTFQRAYAGTNDPQFIQLAEDAMARSRMVQGG